MSLSKPCRKCTCRQNSARNHETPTLVTDSVARPPPARAGRTARRFGAPLTPHLARRPLCGGRRSAVGGRRTAVGGRPVRRGALRCGQIQFHLARGRLLSGTGPLVVIFSFRTRNIDKNRPPWRNKGVQGQGGASPVRHSGLGWSQVALTSLIRGSVIYITEGHGRHVRGRGARIRDSDMPLT